jgi:RES domain-containing protein
VHDLGVADLSTEERLQAVGLQLPRPSRQTWPPFQAVGEQLFAEGWRGLLAPSAARPESLVLCVFLEPAAPFPREIKPVPPPTVVEEPPLVPLGLRT